MVLKLSNLRFSLTIIHIEKNEIENLLDFANKNKLDLITTEKDHYRLKKLGFNINYLTIKVQIEKKDKFEKLIKSHI